MKTLRGPALNVSARRLLQSYVRDTSIAALPGEPGTSFPFPAFPVGPTYSFVTQAGDTVGPDVAAAVPVTNLAPAARCPLSPHEAGGRTRIVRLRAERRLCALP